VGQTLRTWIKETRLLLCLVVANPAKEAGAAARTEWFACALAGLCRLSGHASIHCIAGLFLAEAGE
jgi:hypothetical protein